MTQTWPIRELNFSGHRDWSTDGHVIPAELIEPCNFCRACWEGKRPGGRWGWSSGSHFATMRG